jgi:hypothetical protein
MTASQVSSFNNLSADERPGPMFKTGSLPGSLTIHFVHNFLPIFFYRFA